MALVCNHQSLELSGREKIMNKKVDQNPVYTCSVDSPLGTLTAAAENSAITGLWFVGQKYYPARISHWVENENYPIFVALRNWVAGYFSGETDLPELLLAPNGTEFQKIVWNLLLEIPYGKTTTYGEIAGKVAAQMGLSSMSSQAVGGAVGHNPVSILIPCHRVVGSNRSLTGYAGGLDRKEALLKLENPDLPLKLKTLRDFKSSQTDDRQSHAC